MPRDTLLETKESVVTVRSVCVGLMLTAAMLVAIPASNPASAGEETGPCTCAKSTIQARPHTRVAHKQRVRQPRGQAYAERFYNYWAAAPVSVVGWHGEWRQAPDDWVAPAD